MDEWKKQRPREENLFDPCWSAIDKLERWDWDKLTNEQN